MARLILLSLLISLTACQGNQVKNTSDIKLILDKWVEADTFYMEGDCERALPLYQSLASSQQSDTKSLLRIGNCYAQNKEYREAEQAYKQALLRDPSYSKAWLNLSHIRAQILADTVKDMYSHTDPSSFDAEKIRALTIEVLAPFEIELDIERVE